MAGGEIAAGVAVFNTLKSLADIVRNVRETNDPDKLRNAASQMADMVLAAQKQAALFQQEYLAVAAKALALEKEVERLHAFNEKSEDYEKQPRGPFGTLVYVRKDSASPQADPETFCIHCFDNKKLSTLQPTAKEVGRERMFLCPQCKTEYVW